MDLDRRTFIAALGGAAVVASMSDEAKADALEQHLLAQANAPGADVGRSDAPEGRGEDLLTNGAHPDVTANFPTAAQVEAQIETRASRRGVGNLFVATQGHVARLPPMPARPTLADYFRLRFVATSNHCLQSANRAMKNGMSEEIILACLLHDTVQELIKVDHGWWGAQMYEPYVSPKVAFAIRYHQALRFYEDQEHGYHYPDLYRRMYGSDYTPEPYIRATYERVRKHKWYLEPRMVTVNDLYAFEPNVHPTFEQFADIVGRQFHQPAQGLGFDDSPVAHMWRSVAMPDHPL